MYHLPILTMKFKASLSSSIEKTFSTGMYTFCVCSRKSASFSHLQGRLKEKIIIGILLSRSIETYGTAVFLTLGVYAINESGTNRKAR